MHLKQAVTAIYTNSHSTMNPSTMYTPEPHHWDQPIPVWAVRPPQATWDPEYLQSLDPRYADPMRLTPSRHRRAAKTTPRKREKRQRPAEQTLPDGTIVVPIVDEDDYIQEYDAYRTDGYMKRSRKKSAESDDDGKSSHVGSVRSLSSKYRNTPNKCLSDEPEYLEADDAGTIIAVSTTRRPMSEDRNSIVSLSDKYRTQEEIEIFQGHQGYKLPPEPIRPNFASNDTDRNRPLTTF